MKSVPASLFPLKLILGYLIAVALIPDIGYELESGNFEVTTELWNLDLLLSLILCSPLVVVIIFAGWHFRRMPYFAFGCILASSFLLIDAIASYFTTGFDSRFEVNFMRLNTTGFFIILAGLAVPFLIAYFIRRFGPRKKLAKP